MLDSGRNNKGIKKDLAMAAKKAGLKYHLQVTYQPQVSFTGNLAVSSIICR
jgi:hypothetical protein